MLGRGAACADDMRRRLQGRPDLVLEIVLDGNVVVTIFATKTTTDSTCPDCVDSFIDALKSDDLTAILAESGLKRPF